MTTTAEQTTAATGVAGRVTALVAPLFGGALPVRVRAWDGSQAGPADASTVVIASPDALRRLVARPGCQRKGRPA